MKVIGTKKDRTPLECYRAQESLIAELKKTCPIKNTKGLILKFKTWDDLYEFNLKRAGLRVGKP